MVGRKMKGEKRGGMDVLKEYEQGNSEKGGGMVVLRETGGCDRSLEQDLRVQERAWLHQEARGGHPKSLG